LGDRRALVPDGKLPRYKVVPLDLPDGHQVRILDGGTRKQTVITGRSSDLDALDATTAGQRVSRFEPEVAGPYVDVRMADVNGDGRPDLAGLWVHADGRRLGRAAGRVPLVAAGAGEAREGVRRRRRGVRVAGHKPASGGRSCSALAPVPRGRAWRASGPSTAVWRTAARKQWVSIASVGSVDPLSQASEDNEEVRDPLTRSEAPLAIP
jgi:hypothetical protein